MATATDERRGTVRLLLGGLVAALLLAVLALSLDVEVTLATLRAAEPGAVALAVGLGLFAQGCWSLTMVTIVGGVDRTAPRGRVSLCYFAGTFGKQVLPLGAAGGSAIIAYVLADDLDRRFTDVFGAVTASELLVFAGSLGVAALGMASLVVDPLPGLDGAAVLGVLALVVAALVAGGAALAYRRTALRRVVELAAGLVRATVGRVSVRVARSLRPDRVSAAVETFFDGFGAATGDTRRLAVAAALSVVGWVAFSLSLVASLGAVDVPLATGLALFLVPAAGVATLVPTPGGLGTTELGLTAVVTLASAASPELAAAGVVVYRLATYWLIVAVGGAASLYLSTTVWHALD
ncbi:lysylphosphatidylglycerol synthase transmembrane domain-containing protein [Haloarcula litorea]|uniref:lysylphosphatidylglycerol synthase transmembrane domain-containing protein n=1 Tax=Haloarcula litorea TaxID=3032579 RepID=UPI0023E8BF39|nr:lysylphosphatidylglycerol synthase transmembrane domain-containing protein [Halomicroarcula sp. GDY20]